MLKHSQPFYLLLMGFLACRQEKVSNPEEEAGPQYASEFTAVMMDPEAQPSFQLAVQACVGLYNRRLGGSVYLQRDAHDDEWLSELGLSPASSLSASDFLNNCLSDFSECLHYDYSTQQEILPSILTVASAREAVPLDVALDISCPEVTFNAIEAFADINTPALASQHSFELVGDQTTGLAMLNPGYDIHAEDLSNPELIHDMSEAMVDFVFSERLFATFLNNGCIDNHPEKEVLDEIVNAGHWPSPIGVYGYNDSWLVGGYIYEAQTRCLDSRNMGAIPTKTNNLSFFSTRRPAIEDVGVLQPNDAESIVYDASQSYVAFIVGDGDNIHFIMTTRNTWLRQRLAGCEASEADCKPLTWSISPHLTQIAPDVLEWYYALSRQTGQDYFTLPPSGYLYAYPASLNASDQDRFVTLTEQSAELFGLHTTVHWEWFDTWDAAQEEFLPKYATENGPIQAVIPVNVPYSLDAFPGWPDDKFYEVLSGSGGELVLFRPRQWRGIDDRDDLFFLNPQRMADEISSYPAGTVTAIYMTSDGGLNLENSFFELVGLLPPHVTLVSADTAARLALEANRSAD